MCHKGIVCVVLAGVWIGLVGARSSALSGEGPPPIASPPQALDPDPFYKQYLDCGGIPILASQRVAGAALHKAHELIRRMLAPVEVTGEMVIGIVERLAKVTIPHRDDAIHLIYKVRDRTFAPPKLRPPVHPGD